MVHSLIKSCDLLSHMNVVSSQAATFDQLSRFHCQDYLQAMIDGADLDESDLDKFEEFGFGYDCPLRPRTFEYCSRIGGGSLTAAKLLCARESLVAVHWAGGWHHAKRSKASGYCYVNDCVLAITQLTQSFKRVLYVDVDLHHGDGVEEAFASTRRVMTFSIHNHHPGFFPGSGAVSDVGKHRGHLHTINFPLKEGARDEIFKAYTIKALRLIKDKFDPDAVVCQFGADGLNEDPMKSFNLTPDSFANILKYIIGWELPTLLLGGGGYNEANVARCWTTLTAALLGKQLPDEIPEHDFFDLYGPGFEFEISPSMRKDLNTTDYLDGVLQTIAKNLDNIPQL